MRIIGKKKLIKLKSKNKGNVKLCNEIDVLIKDLEQPNLTEAILRTLRDDVDCVHNDGFYFFNIKAHRTLILLEFDEDEATIVWVGSHQDYDITFKNNKPSIEKWLRRHNHIE